MWPMFTIIVICLLPNNVLGSCNRIPVHASGERSSVDDNFKILIDGNPTTYIPDHKYNVSLSCPHNLKFISFTLVVEIEDDVLHESDLDRTGHFELFNDADTKFSLGCDNMVENTNSNPKNRIQVSWVAPKLTESGCVLIKAAVLQHRDVWFIDDGFLTKRICPEEIDELNSSTPPLKYCCVCDEAKYEIILERKWARNTHAKHFPGESLHARLGVMIGASHSFNYRYWTYGGRASQGLRALAEHGATRALEQEIRAKAQNGHVRTIIKAPGVSNRLSTGITLANARVDSQHHQISVVSKIDPSPDWIIGVAGLELCLSNCTWVERKELNLYPWDIGTDSGPSYVSADQPQVPPDVIRRITSSHPNDYRSPFFDETGAPMKPLARLYLIRKKLYTKECNFVSPGKPLECATHPWSAWSNCSMLCGPGFTRRVRSYKSPALAANYNCTDVTLEEVHQCQGNNCGKKFEDVDYDRIEGVAAECELTIWSNWSSCSKSCGKGFTTRTRDFRNAHARANCLVGVTLPLMEKMECTGTKCGGTIPGNFYVPDYMNNLPEQQLFEKAIEAGYEGIESTNKYNTNLERPQFETHSSSQAKPFAGNLPKHTSYNDFDLVAPSQYPPTSTIPELVDEFKGLTVSGVDATPYNIVQDYCFAKPFAATRPCMADPLIVRNYWFYDHEDHECKIFTTDNCDENQNRFRTVEACEGTCLYPLTNRELVEDASLTAKDRFNRNQAKASEQQDIADPPSKPALAPLNLTSASTSRVSPT
ncbi:spondin-1 [Scaptodrosophila lebanonensis]|uniref:Spondin-1 n=1 Tax=Drosophila lebanonensis TaxID=7225 RepID=A0A6J2THQ4_DROLE|nr:spondin-1 [Scaptodrosophila lebanonensis]